MVPVVGACTDDDDDLLDKWLSDVDDCYSLAQQVSHKFLITTA